MRNKDADQLGGIREADQRLCFHYIDSTIPLLFKPLAILCGCTAQFMSVLVGIPKTGFVQRGSIDSTVSFFTRYLSTKIDFLVSAEMNTFYLSTLRETVWPDDQLLIETRPNYTDRQKEGIKKQAARCLGDFLPGNITVL